ncbi:Uncharacterized N-acetyltransferase YjhQ [Candidatus Terasakiella magnetica]|uniref:Uncharacterized N-acetyltransferase YjhQ n=1 Tax=Candidatus Terasakiella magnetica TaxID=1867952 RepID=A0A1C3RIK0_9PROT|nr:N-acetyltransferase [Candidatus Terasakiella magnetica]SCA57101.1 Uncharacterized N-acetyltransferase YjhQ [Candidatus Terasakiella magnetica]
MIRKAVEKDLKDILEIHRLAFNEEDEAELVDQLLIDPTAQPCLSLVGEQDGQIVAHILFTKASVDSTSAYLLAPLAVHPDVQYKGWGKRLINAGLKSLKKMGVDLVFVLGDPNYYPRSGFQCNAGALGFPTPQPIPAQYNEAWMVQELRDGVIGQAKGTVNVADAIAPIEFWSE